MFLEDSNSVQNRHRILQLGSESKVPVFFSGIREGGLIFEIVVENDIQKRTYYLSLRAGGISGVLETTTSKILSKNHRLCEIVKFRQKSQKSREHVTFRDLEGQRCYLRR